MTERKKPQEEETPALSVVAFTKKTEDWMRGTVFPDKSQAEKDKYVQNLRAALRSHNPSLLYEGVDRGDSRTLVRLGMLYNALDTGKSKILYSLSESKKQEFGKRLEAHEKSARPVKVVQELDSGTEQWIRDRVFSKDGKAGAYLQNLKDALAKRDRDKLEKSVDDLRASMALTVIYDKLADNPGFFRAASARKDFERLTLKFIEGEAAEEARKPVRAGEMKVSFVDEGAKRAEKNYVRIEAGGKSYLVEFQNPMKLADETALQAGSSVTALALNYGGRNAKVIQLSAEGEAERTFDLSDIRQAQELSRETSTKAEVTTLPEPTAKGLLARSSIRIETAGNTFYVETPGLTKDELDFYQATLKGKKPMDAITALLKRGDTSVSVMQDGEMRRIQNDSALTLIRLEREKLTVTHRAGKEAFA